jgi:hypothetical protein
MNVVLYRLRDYNGTPLPGSCIDIPRPGERPDDLIRRLSIEFGPRLIEAHVRAQARELSLRAR